MANLEDQQAQLNYEIAVYREQLTMLKRETEKIGLTAIDLGNAMRTVESLGTEKVMMPIGGGAMVKGVVTETKVLMPIGSDYLVEMEKDRAITEINKRIDATKKAAERLNDEFTKIMSKLQEVSLQLQQLSAQARIDKRSKDNSQDDYI